MTTNNCLSKFEIEQLEFSFKIAFHSGTKINTLHIHYNGYEYYKYASNPLSDVGMDQAYPCVAMGSKDSKITILKKTTYP